MSPYAHVRARQGLHAELSKFELWPWVGLVVWRIAVAMTIGAVLLQLSVFDATVLSPAETQPEVP